jgi:hypothetical protein
VTWLPLKSVRSCNRGNTTPACQIDYRYNYSVYQGQRTYYDDQPHAIQVADHVFIELQVVEVFKTAMDVLWSANPCFFVRPSLTLTGYMEFRTLATNCARLYNFALTKGKKAP